jgi:pSer/pThr/pTyr-binding forkhead associated (FHA) protein
MRWRAALIIGVLLSVLGSVTSAPVIVTDVLAQQAPCEIFLTEFTYDQRAEKYFVIVSLTEPCQVGSIDPRLLDLQSGENIRFGDEPIAVTGRMVEFYLPTHQLQPTRKYKLAIRAFQPGSLTYVRRVSQSLSEDPLNFASQEFAYNPPQEVPVVWAVDGVRADFPNHKLQIALHHSDTPKPLQYEMVVADKKNGNVVGRLDRTPLALQNGILEAPLLAAMEETDRAAEYQLTFRLYADRKLLGDRIKDFTLPAPPRPGPVQQLSLALETHPWLRWSLAGIVVLLCLAYAAKELLPRKRKPLPRPQNLAPVFTVAPPPIGPTRVMAAAAAPSGAGALPPVAPAPVAPAPVAPAPVAAAPAAPAPVVSAPVAVERPQLSTPPKVVSRPVETPAQATPGPTMPMPEMIVGASEAMLVVTSTSGVETPYVLNKQEHTIGRAPDNDIVVNDLLASRRHAQVASEAGTFLWHDRDGVTRPTHINGNAVGQPHALQDGDTIEVGATTLVFRAAAPVGIGATELQPALETMAAGTFITIVIGDVPYPVAKGMKLEGHVLGAVGADRSDAPFAEVVASSNDESVLELRNLSDTPWTVGLPTGEVAIIQNGASFRLDDGVRFDFGGIRGRVEI